MKPADLLKHAREKKGWTQRQLAQAIGVTPGFVTKVEGAEAFPSYERCIALANVLDLPLDRLWTAIEQARAEAFKVQMRVRGAAVRQAVRVRGMAPEPPPGAPVPEMSAEEIAHEIAADAALQAAYQDLKRALADPELRETVLNALRAFARAAHPGA